MGLDGAENARFETQPPCSLQAASRNRKWIDSGGFRAVCKTPGQTSYPCRNKGIVAGGCAMNRRTVFAVTREHAGGMTHAGWRQEADDGRRPKQKAHPRGRAANRTPQTKGRLLRAVHRNGSREHSRSRAFQSSSTRIAPLEVTRCACDNRSCYNADIRDENTVPVG